METSVDHAHGIFRDTGRANASYVFRVRNWRNIISCWSIDTRGWRLDGCNYIEAC